MGTVGSPNVPHTNERPVNVYGTAIYGGMLFGYG